jgi:hypothetical protein
MQLRPIWQGVVPAPVQQGWVAAPQAWHRLVMQRLPVEQVPPPPPAQQAWPTPPQGPQLPVVFEAATRPEQVSVAALHEPLLPVPQHACPSAPQVPHWLPVAVSMQPMPVWHWLVPPPPAQQAWPAPPQGPQVPVVFEAVARPVQASVAALHEPLLPVPQHACPSAPQVPHWLPVAVSMQLMPVWHWLVPPPPAQQAWPAPPQGPQVPAAPVVRSRPWHARPDEQVPALPVPQQAWPEPPHDSQIAPASAP